ncbi:1,4-dihydroxy-2-naphthoate polyprenyltransferase [Sulfoacidibacillus thermotolerans]|uniref:1,4-dihydroxy-2-naphthoate octaprenyltransferase n=1 Tax=Sulfoacidibacillus thermotolerans TaxID=1765684 RepID=A0A2U3D9E7_SULT2|nr:1,4-dihydroxy-2-naphthoate polyprenyltransferase [Sulfoacidibacillus thermotolerans]PWI57904.1 1,4-dihydroxy-2-naphthoate octaprenyltransferase [Sulfoacidibacillus thermotolerans]
MPSNWLAILWRLMRPPTLTASVTPVLVGTGLALQHAALHFDLFLAMLLAAVLIQAAANMINEYADYARGLDNKDMVGIAGTIVRDGVSPHTVLIIFFATLFISLGLGAYIAANTSWWVAVAGTLSMIFMYLYSSGPHPISYTPFGEVTAGILMGPVIILISYYIQTSHLSLTAVVASLPIGLLIGAILLANNIRDVEHDLPGGRKTLPVILGKERAIMLLQGVFVLSYLIIAILVVVQLLTPFSLLTLLAYPFSARIGAMFRRATNPSELQRAFTSTSFTLIRFGILLFLGLLAGAFLPL